MMVVWWVAGLRAGDVELGSEVLARSGFKSLQGKRIGLITNPSGVNRDLESTIEILRRAPGVQLMALFGPEHGIYGDVAAGDKIESRLDPRTGLMVHSLYGATRKPTPQMLQGLDALVYDLQDTGCRSYTYISTMGLAMEACGEAGIEFIVLDRPNPLGGERIEGSCLDERFRSFVSQWDVPYVYGMSCGELARMIQGEHWIRATNKLTVIKMRGWKRSMTWADTGFPWAPTSPHVPHGDSPLYQVATGMLGEIGGVNIGIGYTLPFECIAAPGINPQALARALNDCRLAGIRFRPISFKPYYATFKDELISGVQLHFTDRAKAPLTAVNLYALEVLKRDFALDLFNNAVKSGKNFSMFDKVNGSDSVRKQLMSGTSARNIVGAWKADEEAFRKRRKPYLLY